MTIWSSDDKRFSDIGTSWWWMSLKLTVTKRLKDILEQIPNAVNFLNTLECMHDKCKETAEELKIIRENLALLPIEEIVLEKDRKVNKKEIIKGIDKTVASCNDFFLTSDGKKMLSELIDIFEYSAENNCDVVCAI